MNTNYLVSSFMNQLYEMDNNPEKSAEVAARRAAHMDSKKTHWDRNKGKYKHASIAGLGIVGGVGLKHLISRYLKKRRAQQN